MKKLLFAVATAALLFSFASCAKEDPAQGVNVDEVFPYKATISGTAYVNINQNGKDPVQYAKEGTVLVLTATNADLLGSGSGNHVVPVTIGSNGAFSTSFPARTDGRPVTVTITSGEFLLKDIYTSATEYSDATFKANPVSVSIIRDGAYVKDLKFDMTELDESKKEAGWEEGTYVFDDIEYRNNDTDPSKRSNPSNFEVKIIVDKNQFVPARQSDLVLTGTVTNGKLTVTLNAPTVGVNPNGLPFRVEGATILEVRQNAANGNGTVDNKFVHSLNVSRTIYGGTAAKIEESRVQMQRGTQITFN